jgi:DNA-binding CsgD family transcriptional regulator
MRLAMSAPLHQALDQGATLGLADFMRSDLYNEVYRPQEQLPFLGAICVRSETTFCGFALMRSTHGKLADEGDFAFADKISHHVGRAVMLARIFEPSPGGANAFEAALLQAREAVFLLSGDGMVVWRNGAAERLLAEQGGLSLKAHRLATAGGKDQRALNDALTVAACGGDAVATVARLSGMSLVVRATPLWRRLSDRSVRVMATITEARASLRLAPQDAMRLFDLTLAEARVACEICAQAGGVAGAARRLGLSRNTIKTLLQRVFAKTGVSSQSELSILFATSLVERSED